MRNADLERERLVLASAGWRPRHVREPEYLNRLRDAIATLPASMRAEAGRTGWTSASILDEQCRLRDWGRAAFTLAIGQARRDLISGPTGQISRLHRPAVLIEPHIGHGSTIFGLIRQVHGDVAMFTSSERNLVDNGLLPATAAGVRAAKRHLARGGILVTQPDAPAGVLAAKGRRSSVDAEGAILLPGLKTAMWLRASTNASAAVVYHTIHETEPLIRVRLHIVPDEATEIQVGKLISSIIMEHLGQWRLLLFAGLSQ